MAVVEEARNRPISLVRAPSTAESRGRHRAPHVPAASGQVLPIPPNQQQKYSYVYRELPLLVLTSLVSISCLIVSQVHFIRLNPWLLVFVPFLVFTIAYYLISLRISLTSRNFRLDRHQELVSNWRPLAYPSVDILLPICNEPISVLRNTWTYVQRLAEYYPGRVSVYVLDDGNDARAGTLAKQVRFEYLVRPNRGWFKKAGNLRHGYQQSNGDFLVIFDADFCPRTDFLHETLPYMYAYPDLGIVQTPQYFRVDRRQTWMERGAGAVQELFYRVVQVSRDGLNGAICVGSCGVYRREALDAIGGTALIEHSEDVHTGFDLARSGWRLRYLPINLAMGLCPEDPDSFFVQQYRWCAGSMSLLGSRKFWKSKLRFSTRLCYLSGFCYYMHTAVFTFVTPMIPIVLIVTLPNEVRLANYLWILPSTVYNLIVFPLWNKTKFGKEAMMARYLYGWSHAFAIWDILRKRQMGWQSTGSSSKKNTHRMWKAIGIFGGVTSAAWVVSAGIRLVQYGFWNYIFLFATGLLYASMVAMAFHSRKQWRRIIVLPERNPASLRRIQPVPDRSA
jgi:cellulose synthase (UDP-forming)